MGNKTDVYSVRLNVRLHAIGKILIARHPRTLSHSWIYSEGLKATIEKASKQGENIPDDPIGELLKINQETITELQKEQDNLTTLQRKHQEQASQSLAGSPGLKPKPGYRYVDSTDERGKPIRIAEEINDD